MACFLRWQGWSGYEYLLDCFAFEKLMYRRKYVTLRFIFKLLYNKVDCVCLLANLDSPWYFQITFEAR